MYKVDKPTVTRDGDMGKVGWEYKKIICKKLVNMGKMGVISS